MRKLCCTKNMSKLKENLQMQIPAKTTNSNAEIDEPRKKLTEKYDALHYMESLNHTLIAKESMSNQEPQDACKESISLKENLDTVSPAETSNSNAEIDELKKGLKEKDDALHYMESLNHTLIAKESMSNQELQDARKESISGLKDILSSRIALAFKRMGEVDHKAFQEVCLHKFSNEDWEEISAKLCSVWNEYVKDPHWHPFKKEIVKGQLQEIIDDDDAKLKELKNEYGGVAYGAVTNALLELNEYNPSGRYPIPVVWNLKERRRASMKEIIQYIIKQLNSNKRKRRF